MNGTEETGTMNSSRITRRSLIINGGAAAGAGLLLAACGQESGLARIGDAPATTALPTEHISDVVLLRTAQSVENLALKALADPTVTAKAGDKSKSAIAIFTAGHKANVSKLSALVAARGGQDVTEANTKMVQNYLDAAVALIKDSDDAETDVNVFLGALEALVAGTYQAFVGWTNEAALRADLMTLAVNPSRYSAAAAQLVRGGTKGIIPALDDAGNALVATLPNAFGQLSGFDASLGKPNDAGVKASVSMETPSLNSLEY